MLSLLPVAMRAGSDDVSGESVFVVPETMSITEARTVAASRARIDALAGKYGTLVASMNTVGMSDGTVNRFSMLGTSEVKGVWLKDTREVWQRMELDEATQQLYIRTKVWGKARPLAVAATPVVAETISDDGDTGSTATEFRNGEKFYLHFRSAADGYLAVFLIDASGSVFTCLPYPSQRQNTVPVRKSTDYVFFSKRRPAAVTAESDIRQYFLTAEKDMEQNRLCIVFSPNDFTLALDEKQGVSANGQQVGRYSFDDFNEALFRQRMADGRMQVVFKDIVIRKK